ncbi:MAG TPA: WecB/TagA/CpsF family glycosyltransferase [Steroidobacteraceae bacterium]|nr:WecB/TagA/CpsF family glycosyltransferase [Steroidobacteraceae bacterium]
MTNHTENHTGRILGVSIWNEGLDALLARTLAAIHAHRAEAARPFVFACANPHSLVVAERDQEFTAALHEADAVVADGVGLTFAARICRRDLGPRITGSDYFVATMQALNERGGRVAFFGSKPEVLALLSGRCRREFPHVTIAATISPPWGAWSQAQDAQFTAQIRDAHVDVLWVGLTAPKQEKWVQRNLGALQAGAVGSIGAVFDYFAGTVVRAPKWICDRGLEWAWRFAREPARLWERNLVSGPRFLALAVAEALGLRPDRDEREGTARI